MSASTAISRSQTAPLVTGEYPFSLADFREIAGIVKSSSGIDLHESKAALVYSRLAKRLRGLGLAKFDAYCDLVRSDDAERHQMIAALTTNVTRFFRESHHFDHLRDVVIKPMADAAKRGARLRIWSAACSTGQEPYSIAMTILSVLPEAPNLDIKILATDLNPHVVATGQAGVYPDDLVGDIPKEMRTRWMEKSSDGIETNWTMAPAVKSLVTFRELNLLGQWPMKNSFDVVFCRNVVIYFDRPTQSSLWQRFERLLKPGGALYIGHSERLSENVIPSFRTDGITTFIKGGSAS